jgi:phosphoesterase RecJ-like protein
MTTVETAQALLKLDQVLILTHVRPDGDTLGCAGALCQALRDLGKTAYLLPNTGITETYAPYVVDFWAPEGFVPAHVISTDVAALELLPENAAVYQNQIEIAIDHHPSYGNFAKSCCVVPQAAAAGEIIYDIIRQMTAVTAPIALLLYIAVSTDTGCFVYANTTANTHRVAAALIDTGIDYRTVNKALFRTKSKTRMAMEAQMAANMELYDHDRIVVMAIPLSLRQEMHATEADIEELSSLAALVEGTDCGVTLRELSPDRWKLSLRTGPRVNATEACALLGGGGHRAAAGATITGSYEQVRAAVLDAVAKVVGD